MLTSERSFAKVSASTSGRPSFETWSGSVGRSMSAMGAMLAGLSTLDTCGELGLQHRAWLLHASPSHAASRPVT